MVELLFVDDNAIDRNSWPDALTTAWEAKFGSTLSEKAIVHAVKDLKGEQLSSVCDYDGVILDIVWDVRNRSTHHGVKLAQDIRKAYPEIPIFMLTSQPEPETFSKLLTIGIDGYLTKFMEPESICWIIWEKISRARRERRGQALYKVIRKCVSEKSWNSGFVGDAASAVWRCERPHDRWNSFWANMLQPISRWEGLTTVFKDMRDFFADADLLLLGSVAHMRGHLEHVLAVYFTGYVVSHSVVGFRDCAIASARQLVAHKNGAADVTDDDLWSYFQIAWLAAATLHDTAYALELLPDIQNRCMSIARVFDEIVSADPSIKTPWKVGEWNNSCDEYFEDIGRLLNRLYDRNPFDAKFFAEKSVVMKGGGQRINHGVASGLLFLSKAYKLLANDKESLQMVFLRWASAAMALHSLKVPGHGYAKIQMENDPLSYLLMICDEIQVWDRERPDANAYGSPFRAAYLESFQVGDSRIDCTIKYLPYSEINPDSHEYREAVESLALACDNDNRILRQYVGSKSLRTYIQRKVEQPANNYSVFPMVDF